MPEWESLGQRPVGALAVALPGATVTVGELRAVVGSATRALVARGVRKGARVVVALPNSLECLVAQLAVRVCGGVLVNLPAPLRREIVEIAEQTAAAVVVLPAEAGDDPVLAQLRERFFTVPNDLEPGGADVESVPRASDDVAWLAFTSGTTGSAKGAVHTERTLGRMTQTMIDRYGLGPDDSILVAAPLGHAIAFAYGAQVALRAGCAMVVVPRWEPTVAARLVEEHGCTFVAAPTPFLLDVVELAEAGSTAFASLRHFLCGGAPVPANLIERASRMLGPSVASAYYGTSETGAVTTCPPGAAPEKMRATVGVPLPGMEVRIVDGEVRVRGQQVCDRYWHEDRDAAAFHDDWYLTGDLGELDADGYLVLTGRKKELIIRGGVNISPVEVELALAAEPGVRDVAVVGLPDERLGQRVVAVVVPQGEPPTLDGLRRRCEVLGLAKVKWPEDVIVADALPRSETGKLLRGRLTAELGRAT